MKIKLIRTGGFIPLTKMAETEADLSEDELALLLEVIRSGPASPRIKDGNYWELIVKGESTPIDPDKVPDEHKALFERLKEGLKIVKPTR